MFVPVTNIPAPSVMQWVRLASGYTVYYRQAGIGTPLLLIHGWGGSSRYWRDTINHLSTLRTVYALDLPGYGQSPPMIVESATPERLSRLVVEFANTLNIEYFDVIGHSLGASIAAYVAAGWPTRVNHVVLTCVGTYRNHNERRLIKIVHRLLSIWLRLRQPWMVRVPLMYRRIARNFFYRLPTDDKLLRESVYDFLRMDRRAAKESAIGMVGHTLDSVLRQIAAPTLVIGATHDRLLPKYGPPAVSRLVPNSRLVWIERCGHLPMLEKPESYHSLLREFLMKGLAKEKEPIEAEATIAVEGALP